MTPGGVLDGADVLVEDGRVAAVGETTAGARELDARGCYVLPGGLDPHAHVYEGLGRRARRRAALGHDDGRGLRAARARRARGGRLRALARPGRRDRPAASSRLRPCTSPARSTRRRSRRSPRRACAASSCSSPTASWAWTPTTSVLLRALLWGREHGVVPRLHCENAGAIHVLRERLRAAGDLGVDAHPRSRPPLVEEEGIRRALDLARLAEAPVYIVHVSTAGRRRGDPAGARRGPRRDAARPARSTCCSTRRVYAGPLAPMGVISPPLRPRAHVEAVWRGRARRHAEHHRLRSLAPRLAPVLARSTSSSRAARAWRRACR